jgi:murein L,D-transpeptidase YafK
MKLITSLVLLLLTACAHTVPDQPRNPARGKVAISQWMKDRNNTAGVSDKSAALVRIFKQENQLELWRQKGDRFVLVATFEICKYSGGAGPKKREGDRQAPEGFYDINISSLNPYSREWLSINTGFPNAYDRSKGYSGSALMIHGGCSSIGCYAIKDGPMQDLYASIRDALQAGQHTVQLQIYPHKMGWASDMSGANADFWQQLKQGYDVFESTQQPVPVKIVNGRYVFN